MDEITNGKVNFKNPFMSFKSEDTLSTRLIEELSGEFSIPADEIRQAVHLAWTELAKCREDIRQKKEKKPLHIWIRPVNVVSSWQGAHTTSIRKYTMEFRN